MADMERATKGNIMILLVILGILAILLIIGTGRLAENGYFKTIEDLKNVSGIGDATFEQLKDYITV